MSTSLLWNCVIHYECSCSFETSPKYCIKKWFLITNVAGSYSYFSLHWHDNIISLQIHVSLSEAAGMATGVQIRGCGDVLGRESCSSLLHGTASHGAIPSSPSQGCALDGKCHCSALLWKHNETKQLAGIIALKENWFACLSSERNPVTARHQPWLDWQWFPRPSLLGTLNEHEQL